MSEAASKEQTKREKLREMANNGDLEAQSFYAALYRYRYEEDP